MIFGFFAGTTVKSVQRKADKVRRVVADFKTARDQAIADRQAAIKAAQDDITQLLGINTED